MTPPAALRLALILALAHPLGGCLTTDGAAVETAAVVAVDPPRGPVEIKDDLAVAKDQFARGHYGLAELHFRRAVEADKTSAEAWLGLAASYDKLRRPHLADRAYAAALKLTGPTSEFLNNRGYSFLQRGDLGRASEDLTRAASLAPDDERIQGNLQALDDKVRARF